MNILHVIPYFAPAWAYGGPPRVAYELCRELVRRGHSVTVLTTDAYDSTTRLIRKEEILEGIDVIRLQNLSNRLAWNEQLFLPLGTWARLRSSLQDFDIAHLHLYHTLQNVLAHWYARKYGVPYVLSAHGTVPRIVRRRAAKALFDTVLGERLLRDAQRLIAISEAEKLQYIAAGVHSSDIDVIFNGIDVTAYSDLPPQGEFTKVHRLDGQQIITYVGRLNQRKGLDHLLHAFRDLANVRDDLKLVLAGPDGGYREVLEYLAGRLQISDRVLFTGYLRIEDKLRLLVDSDLVVYPSAHEPFGLVAFEALLCETPVVVSDDSGCGEIIRKARAGITAVAGDVSSLREAILQGLEKGRKAGLMVERGRRFILEHLRWGRIAGEMETAYQAAIDYGSSGARIAS